MPSHRYRAGRGMVRQTQHLEDAIHRAAIIDPRLASRLIEQQRLDHASLQVGQVISAHAEPESELGTYGNFHAGLVKVGDDAT